MLCSRCEGLGAKLLQPLVEALPADILEVSEKSAQEVEIECEIEAANEKPYNGAIEDERRDEHTTEAFVGRIEMRSAVGIVGDVVDGLTAADNLVGIDGNGLEIVLCLDKARQGIVGRRVLQEREGIGRAKFGYGGLGNAIAEGIGVLELAARGGHEDGDCGIGLVGDGGRIGHGHGDGIGEGDAELLLGLLDLGDKECALLVLGTRLSA